MGLQLWFESRLLSYSVSSDVRKGRLICVVTLNHCESQGTKTDGGELLQMI